MIHRMWVSALALTTGFAGAAAAQEADVTSDENVVTAQLRERTRDPKYGWANTSLTSRLPKWIGSARNRTTVLKALAQLKVRLSECL